MVSRDSEYHEFSLSEVRKNIFIFGYLVDIAFSRHFVEFVNISGYVCLMLDLMVRPGFTTEVLSQCHWFAKFLFVFAKFNFIFGNYNKQFANCLSSPCGKISSPTLNSPKCSPSGLHPSPLTGGEQCRMFGNKKGFILV